MAAITQTVAIVNRSGKVVKTSKHLVNVFKEARSAYRERKAELRAIRDADIKQNQARKALEDFTFDDTRSATSSRVSKTKTVRSHKSRSSRKEEIAPAMERGYSDSFYTNDDVARSKPAKTTSSSPLRNETNDPRQTQSCELARRDTRQELVRRNTAQDLATVPAARLQPVRSHSESHIDLDLAYGELPPPLPVRSRDDASELRGQVSKLQQLLDEANCLQHSVSAMISSLESNPDALAAVALTLAEISNLAAKMAPGALTALKGSFPAVVALLASPEFMIAAGVGVGITIVALGGYKIIKKIRSKKEGEVESPVEELQELQEVELNTDVSRIELWRRGIAEAEAEAEVQAEATEAKSVVTSVDGEFVTPQAGKQLIEQGTLRPEDLKDTQSERKKSRRKHKSKSKSGDSRKTTKERHGPKEWRDSSKLKHWF
ncbi:MAG: hypothetical protein M1821_003833 [Bathelium mastoideum]|nr:MAG: hypothetical protein M1821_003833 [Bathelium mastoideum]